ncbi:MAG: alpha/beta hydrolase [Waddliaceae bacterium]
MKTTRFFLAIAAILFLLEGEIAAMERESVQFVEDRLIKNGSVSVDVSMMNMQELVNEIAWKEPGALYASIKNYLAYTYNPHRYGLDSLEPMIDTVNKVAKVVLLLHGAGGGPYTFLDWAKEYERVGITNVYTVDLQQTDDDPVPLHQITEKIRSIASQCFSAGAEVVDLSLQGHSLGALVASKYVWRAEPFDDRVSVSMFISIGGRLHYDDCQFSWFCEGVRPEIEQTYDEYVKNPLKVDLYTVWGAMDGIVPKESVHIQGFPDRELSVEDCGHLGIMYARQAIDQAAQWTKQWTQNNQTITPILNKSTFSKYP